VDLFQFPDATSLVNQKLKIINQWRGKESSINPGNRVRMARRERQTNPVNKASQQTISLPYFAYARRNPEYTVTGLNPSSTWDPTSTPPAESTIFTY
jgi:hypothetical protein